MNISQNNISVIIITYNEEKNIKDCLESVKWANEIIVIDAESVDSTIDIAKNYTDKIFVRKWEGYSSQRQYSLEKANNEWVLSLDADERVTDDLRKEIDFVLLNNNCINGYYIPRRNYFYRQEIKTCFWYPDYQLRLFRKKFASINHRKVHEGFEVDGKKDYLKNGLIHYAHRSFNDTFHKINTYSYLQAQERYNDKKIKTFDLVLHPFAAFLNHFISRKGYKDGVYGLMVSLVHMITNLMTYLKMWELQNVEKKRN